MTQPPMLHVISLGAGVQSSTMALLAAHGRLTPMPTAAIFADTQAEPQAVYDWLTWIEPKLPFPLYRVTAGSLLDIIGAARKTGRWPHMPIPAFIQGNDKQRPGPANRSCTQDYKILPIRRQLRHLAGIHRKRSPTYPIATQWIGISTDEAHRMKPSREAWTQHRWPLIELGMSRENCLRWMRRHDYPRPPKSACTFCPYHDDAQWLAIKNDPAAWQQAVAVDERIRDLWHGRVPSQIFLHRSMIPLTDVTFAPRKRNRSGFGNECEGICGV